MTEEKRPNHRPPKARKIDADALDRDFFTIYEVADMLGLHWQTIRRMIKAGELPAKKYGSAWRVRRVDLEVFTQPIDTPPRLDPKAEEKLEA